MAATVIDFHKIARCGLPHLITILDRLGVEHRRAGSEIEMLNPTRNDRRFGSFRVNIRSGRWADFATGDTGGDVVALVAHLTDCRQAEAASFLTGLSDWRPGPHKIERRKVEEMAERHRRIDLARRCWSEAEPISETLGESYLRARRITCDLPPTLRFHANCWHSPTAQKLPAMVAAVGPGQTITGIHRTYLAEPGTKAFGNDSKLMLGRCAGGAVRLSGGDGPLVVAEGIETALSILSGLPDASPRVWAALSTSGMAGLVLPRDPGELVIAPDGEDAGRKAADKLADRACAAGWRVRIMKCPDGADWNDIASEVAA